MGQSSMIWWLYTLYKQSFKWYQQLGKIINTINNDLVFNPNKPKRKIQMCYVVVVVVGKGDSVAGCSVTSCGGTTLQFWLESTKNLSQPLINHS